MPLQEESAFVKFLYWIHTTCRMDVGEIRRVLASLRTDVDPNKTLTNADIKRIKAKSAKLGRLANNG